MTFGLASSLRLCVHAVVRGHHEHRAERVELAQVPIEHRIKTVRVLVTRRVLVLNVVGGRQVQQIGAPRLQQLHSGGEHELR